MLRWSWHGSSAQPNHPLFSSAWRRTNRGGRTRRSTAKTTWCRCSTSINAAWALIRQWAGQDAALAQKDAEIQRLERLAWVAIYALQKAGNDSRMAPAGDSGVVIARDSFWLR
jgi:hypothetical protein